MWSLVQQGSQIATKGRVSLSSPLSSHKGVSIRKTIFHIFTSMIHIVVVVVVKDIPRNLCPTYIKEKDFDMNEYKGQICRKGNAVKQSTSLSIRRKVY